MSYWREALYKLRLLRARELNCYLFSHCQSLDFVIAAKPIHYLILSALDYIPLKFVC